MPHTGGHQPTHWTSEPPENMVSGLLEIVDADSSLGMLPFPSPHRPDCLKSTPFTCRDELDIVIIVLGRGDVTPHRTVGAGIISGEAVE